MDAIGAQLDHEARDTSCTRSATEKGGRAKAPKQLEPDFQTDADHIRLLYYFRWLFVEPQWYSSNRFVVVSAETRELIVQRKLLVIEDWREPIRGALNRWVVVRGQGTSWNDPYHPNQMPLAQPLITFLALERSALSDVGGPILAPENSSHVGSTRSSPTSCSLCPRNCRPRDPNAAFWLDSLDDYFPLFPREARCIEIRFKAHSFRF
jgi:hypothetical protein